MPNDPTEANAAPTVLLVIGYGRSGSTILDVLLGSDPRIEGVGELVNLAGPGWIDDDYCACGKRVGACEYWSTVREAVEARAGAFDPREYVHLQGHFERHPWRAWMAASSRDRTRYARLTNAIYSAIQQVGDRSVIVDSSKDPRRAMALSSVMGGDVHVLHLVRDPRGVAWSLLRPHRRDAEGGVARDIPSRPAWRSSLRWSWTNLLSEIAARRFPARRRMTLRYEDLLADPVGTLERVGRSIGVDLGALGKRVAAGEEMTSRHKVAGNRLRMQGPVHLNADLEWRDRLSARDRAVVRAIAGPLMRRYGYGS